MRQDVHPAQDAHGAEGLAESKVLSQQGHAQNNAHQRHDVEEDGRLPCPHHLDPHVPEDHGAHAADPDDIDHTGQGRAAHAVHVQLAGQRGVDEGARRPEQPGPGRGRQGRKMAHDAEARQGIDGPAQLGGEEQQIPLVEGDMQQYVYLSLADEEQRPGHGKQDPQQFDGQQAFAQEDQGHQCRHGRSGRGDESGIADRGELQTGELGDIVERHTGDAHEQQGRHQAQRRQERQPPPAHEREKGDAHEQITHCGHGGRVQLPHGDLDQQRLGAPQGGRQGQQGKISACGCRHDLLQRPSCARTIAQNKRFFEIYARRIPAGPPRS